MFVTCKGFLSHLLLGLTFEFKFLSVSSIIGLSVFVSVCLSVFEVTEISVKTVKVH